MSRRLVLAFVAALFATPSCSQPRDVCQEVSDKLAACGLPSAKLACEGSDRGAAEAVAERLDSRGCEGAGQASDEDAVDPRICKLAGWSCPPSPTPAPGAPQAKYPLVFVSGIDGSPLFDWNPRVVSGARDNAKPLHVRLTSWGSTHTRATDLWQSLASFRERGEGPKFNLVCYAVAGIDCRFLASQAGLFAGDEGQYAEVADAIASVTTIATPHRGTRVAEALDAALSSSAAKDLLAALVGTSSEAPAPDTGALHDVLSAISLDAMADFNARVADAPGVYYQSFAGVSHALGRTSAASEASIREHCVDADGNFAFFRHKDTRDTLAPPLLATVAFASVSRDAGGRVITSPSDGMVSVESAKWGAFRGCIPADHYDVIGQMGHTTRDPETGFDAPSFYRFVASDLAGRGL